MKNKLLIGIALIGLLSGCNWTEEQQRLDYIREKFKTNEIWWKDGENSPYYIVRSADGSVWVVQRNSHTELENLTCRQIFGPVK